VAEHVIETAGLRKVYFSRLGKSVVAVEGLDLAVPAGGVHGFLGPNGSGKTTTIRMLLGLARPTDGQMQLFGEPVPSHLPRVMQRIGAVVESPKFLPGFTGHKNLSLLAQSTGLPKSRVDAVLERVSLSERGGDRYKGYSLGMRQRLAIAATLLKEPELLILDEPTNGWIPQGDPGHPHHDPRARVHRCHRAGQLAHPGRDRARQRRGDHRAPGPADREWPRLGGRRRKRGRASAGEGERPAGSRARAGGELAGLPSQRRPPAGARRQ
jgi:ABC-type lipoprotein export system ATPase subunit